MPRNKRGAVGAPLPILKQKFRNMPGTTIRNLKLLKRICHFYGINKHCLYQNHLSSVFADLVQSQRKQQQCSIARFFCFLARGVPPRNENRDKVLLWAKPSVFYVNTNSCTNFNLLGGSEPPPKPFPKSGPLLNLH